MKTFIRPLLLLCVAGIITIKTIAQTVSIPVTLDWQFNLGTTGQVATYSTGTSDYFSLNWIEAGSNLIYKGIANNFGDTLTTFQPVVSSGAGDSTSANLVSFNVRLNAGLSFNPTSISLDCGRYGTDGGLIKIAWKSPDGTITILQSNVKPNRVSATSTPPVYPTHLSYDLSSVSIPVSEGDCGLYIYIYSL